MIEILIGTIGSGKSTYSSQKAKEGWVIVNDDAVTTMLHGGDYTLYNPKLKDLYRAIKSEIIEECVWHGQNVIIDSTNLTKEKRKRYIDVVDLYPVKIKAVVFPFVSAEEHASRRYNSDNRGHSYDKWLMVANEQIGMYEPPSLDEGFDEIVGV